MLAKLIGGRRGRGGGETFVTRHEYGTEAKNAERIGVSVAKRLAVVQADIWAKRGEPDGIYELDPLPKQAHGLLSGGWWMSWLTSFTCKAWRVYGADRQFKIWSRTLCNPRPCVATLSPVSRVHRH